MFLVHSREESNGRMWRANAGGIYSPRRADRLRRRSLQVSAKSRSLTRKKRPSPNTLRASGFGMTVFCFAGELRGDDGLSQI